MCLRSFCGSDVASRCAQLHRCRAKHVEEGQLLLAQEPSPEDVLIVILSYSGNKSMVRQTANTCLEPASWLLYLWIYIKMYVPCLACMDLHFYVCM